MSDDTPALLSRRALLARAAAVGAGAIIPIDFLRGPIAEARAQGARPLADAPETLTQNAAATLEAVCARLIPTDANGPGATEARAARYIDRALGGALSASRDAYRANLAALDTFARASKGAAFDQLSVADQDAVLRDVEAGIPAGFTPGAAAFFNLVLAHTVEGTFSDPYYGGNADFVGWDLLGYPGVRLAVSGGEQRMDRKPARVRRSAYDHAMFAKKRPARARNDPRRPHKPFA
jgi:gluconate 2-dehydrogenase gamma chain